MPQSNIDRKRPASQPVPDNEAGDAVLVVAEQLGKLVTWSRNRFYQDISERAGVAVDRSTISILTALFKNGPIPVYRLAEILSLDRSTVSRQVAATVADGYVSRASANEDARAVILSMTDLGKEIYAKLAAGWRSRAADLLSSWPESDRQDFGRLLVAFTDALDKDVPPSISSAP